MKGFIFDENLPVRLRFSPTLPVSPISKIGKNPSDSEIWDYAKKLEAERPAGTSPDDAPKGSAPQGPQTEPKGTQPQAGGNVKSRLEELKEAADGLAIVSKDADFSNRIIAHSPPPWVVHLRFGNLRKNDFHALLARVWPQIETLLKSHKLVNVYFDQLEGIG